VGAQLADGGGKRKRGLTPNINVTPLVDVVLVLLIIFMVVIPNMQDGKPIEMVKVAKADKLEDGLEPLVVTVDRHETFSFDNDDMPRAAALARLRDAYAENPRRRVLLRGDATLPYSVVREFFREVQELGFSGVALAVGVGREWSSSGEGV
jgi:biopolymer transport protein TolR